MKLPYNYRLFTISTKNNCQKRKTFLAFVVKCCDVHYMSAAHDLLPPTAKGHFAPSKLAAERIAAIKRKTLIPKGMVTLRALSLGLSLIEAEPARVYQTVPEEETK